MLSHLCTALYMLLSFLPVLSPVPVVAVMMRPAVCMSSSCIFALSLSRLRPSYFMLHQNILWMRHSPLFVLRRPTSGLLSQEGVMLLLSLAPLLCLWHLSLFVLSLLRLFPLCLLHGRNRLLLVATMAYWGTSNVIVGRSSVDCHISFSRVPFSQLHSFFHYPTFPKLILSRPLLIRCLSQINSY